MRLTPIEPENPTFDNHDFLNRKPTGDQLTSLIKRIDSPLVIAVDGEWGCGKSHFLKCWKNDDADGITKIYVDAFKQDYLDDPLIALVSALSDAIDDDAPAITQTAMKKIRMFAPIAGRFALRAGIKWVTKETTEDIKAFFDTSAESSAQSTAEDAVNDAGKALIDATDDFWKSETNRQKAMKAFSDALMELTQPENDKPTQNIAIIVDELDRCRPDYALNMLEVIKHFFEIDGINFVLGVNLSSLENSVKARYGAGIDAGKYIQKFIQLQMHLPLELENVRDNFNTSDQMAAYFDEMVDQIGTRSPFHPYIHEYIKIISPLSKISFRDVQRIAATAAVTPTNDLRQNADFILLAGLIVIKVMKPDWVFQLSQNALSFRTISDFFQLDGVDKSTPKSATSSMYRMSTPREIWWVWTLCLLENAEQPDQHVSDALGGYFTSVRCETAIIEHITSHLNAFQMLR